MAWSNLEDGWQRLSVPHRLLLVAYGMFGVSLAGPWVRGEPFMNGFMGAPEEPARVILGVEAVWPLALVGLAGLVFLFGFDAPRYRRLSQLVVWGLAGLAALAFPVWGDFLCFMCEAREVLWGVSVFQAAATAGLLLSIAGLDLPGDLPGGSSKRAR